MIVDGNHLIADEGKVLIKDDIIATEVYLGIRDSADEWSEEYAEQIAHRDAEGKAEGIRILSKFLCNLE